MDVLLSDSENVCMMVVGFCLFGFFLNSKFPPLYVL